MSPDPFRRMQGVYYWVFLGLSIGKVAFMADLTFRTAMQLLSQRDYQGVYDLALGALRRNEKNPMAFFFLGLVASDNGHPDKALEFFAKAAQNGPTQARYLAHHAKALLADGQFDQALTVAERARKLPNNDAYVADMIGIVFSRAGAHDRAVESFQQAIKLDPKWPEFHFNLGASAQFNGDLDMARAAYQNVLALDPDFYRAWFALVGLETQVTDEHVPTLQTLFEKTGYDADAQLLLGHSIAKILEDLGRYEESFDWLVKAKAAKAKQIQFDPATMQQQFAYAKQSPPPQSGVSDIADAPVFIVGLPRTGTTLLDRILSSHPDMMSLGEIDWFVRLLAREQQQGQDNVSLGEWYMDTVRPLAKGKRPIDKTPHNFLHTAHILQALPNAKIIALRRGALDSCLSNYRQMFAIQTRRFDYSYDLANTAAYYRAYDDLMNYFDDHLPQDRFLQIRYEDIVHDQEAQTRKLLAFCDLDWDEACLNFQDNTAAVDTASSVQVREPLHDRSIGRWAHYGDRLDGLKSALGPLAETA